MVVSSLSYVVVVCFLCFVLSLLLLLLRCWCCCCCVAAVGVAGGFCVFLSGCFSFRVDFSLFLLIFSVIQGHC